MGPLPGPTPHIWPLPLVREYRPRRRRACAPSEDPALTCNCSSVTRQCMLGHSLLVQACWLHSNQAVSAAPARAAAGAPAVHPRPDVLNCGPPFMPVQPRPRLVLSRPALGHRPVPSAPGACPVGTRCTPAAVRLQLPAVGAGRTKRAY